ncbi:hypothetical protein FA13DRAFT_714202 [Coprinellus micaceus]|uniref:Uncharacterized protein n=1 Tax=Coprinellus micaceus TaxID=71717 RepID=A0A4Y7TWL6_COPMI|nr:hypothetical protein FA13DRAFT_714202 [Coprinellus micaceus]
MLRAGSSRCGLALCQSGTRPPSIATIWSLQSLMRKQCSGSRQLEPALEGACVSRPLRILTCGCIALHFFPFLLGACGVLVLKRHWKRLLFYFPGLTASPRPHSRFSLPEGTFVTVLIGNVHTTISSQPLLSYRRRV